ncbi:hypothetical protein [Blastococcus aurantiacus]|uniref:hypothetical protein n=1 Tax=Blastococcus aurantiacus TaxID=1550231 RepID=UPI00210102A4|nr:hypothetical protein [Blastococcus aurantiacus]
MLAVVLVGSVVTGLALRASSADSEGGTSALPACADLAETRLGPLGEDPAWNGCLTDDDAAVRAYRYQCSGLRESLVPSGEARRADESAIVFLPDAGLVAATDQEWFRRPRNQHPAYLRTPFALSVPYRCDELRSLPHDGMVLASCDLDDVPLDLHSTQGCSEDGQVYTALGRTCSYPDFDLTTSWEQWSIEPPDLPGRNDDIVLESGPDEQWWAVPAAHRDQRCWTPPDEWDPAWR